MSKFKKCMEEWNVGRLEYWIEKKVSSLLTLIPSFQYSTIPE
jgi:hypothetical protein